MVNQVVRRAISQYPSVDEESLTDALLAVNSRTPLDFQKLLLSNEISFSRDIFNIMNRVDRSTGRLEGEFIPKCAA